MPLNRTTKRIRRDILHRSFWGSALPHLSSGYLFKFDLVGNYPELEPLLNDYEITFPWSSTALPRGVERLGSSEEFLDRMASGDLAGFVLCQGLAVHRSFVQTAGPVATETARRAFQLKSGEAYIHYCQTVPSHRGKGLYTLMLRYILLTLRQKGFQATYISCARSNIASTRGILKAGFQFDSSERALVMLAGHLRISLKSQQPSNASGATGARSNPPWTRAG
jgi:RimJ/RimL family protein N-acetyltransferase